MAYHLVDGFRDRVLHFGRLTLDHHDGQTVQEQRDVGSDVMLGPENPHLESANRGERIVGRFFEVDEFNCQAFVARFAIFTDRCVLEQ